MPRYRRTGGRFYQRNVFRQISPTKERSNRIDCRNRALFSNRTDCEKNIRESQSVEFTRIETRSEYDKTVEIFIEHGGLCMKVVIETARETRTGRITYGTGSHLSTYYV